MDSGAVVAVEPVRLVADADRGVEALYRAEARHLLGMLWMQVGDRAAAEDLVQEAFVRVHRSWRRIDDPVKAPAYLRSVAFNLARSRWRRLATAARPVRVMRMVDAPSAESAAVDSDDRAAVVEALATLSARQRECIVLRFYAGSSDSETAATLGISINSVKTHIRRGLLALGPALEDRRVDQ